MSNVQHKVKNLLNNIQQDYKRYTQLVELLNNQRTLLIERKADRLEQLNKDVEHLYQQLSESTTERAAMLQTLNIPATAEGMQKFFSHLPAVFSDKARLLWNMLEEQVITCKQINDRNARLLNTQQDILNSLLGNQPDLIYQR